MKYCTGKLCTVHVVHKQFVQEVYCAEKSVHGNGVQRMLYNKYGTGKCCTGTCGVHKMLYRELCRYLLYIKVGTEQWHMGNVVQENNVQKMLYTTHGIENVVHGYVVQKVLHR